MHVFLPLLGWVQASQAQSVLGKTEYMMDGCTGGGEGALWITGVQKMKKEHVSPDKENSQNYVFCAVTP